MAQDVNVKCQCGKVTGVIRGLSVAGSNHVQCPCSACQAYAHFLGRADDMMDEQGYTNIFQIDPATLELHTGHEHLACMKVTAKGPLRWYADCCKTPIGNTLPKGGIPFVGILPIFCGYKGTAPEVVALVGPVRGVPFEKPPIPFGQKLRTMRMMAHLSFLMLRWRLRGGKSWKPFFDRETLKPIRKPYVLSDEEREALYARVV